MGVLEPWWGLERCGWVGRMTETLKTGRDSSLDVILKGAKRKPESSRQGFCPVSAVGWVQVPFPERVRLYLRTPIND